MLKRGEVDLAYLLDALQAEEVKRDPNLKLAFSGGIGTFYLDFFDQWDPRSPWHAGRVRLAANYAIDRRALNDAEDLGASRLNGSMAPRGFEFALPIEPYPYDPATAKQLLAAAGYPNIAGEGSEVAWLSCREKTRPRGSWLVRRDGHEASERARRALCSAPPRDRVVR